MKRRIIHLATDEYSLLVDTDVLPEEMREQMQNLAKAIDTGYELSVSVRYAEVLYDVLQDRFSSYGLGAGGVLTPLGAKLEPICDKFL